MTAQNIYTQLGEDIPVCNISQGTQPFVGPLASPETVSSHPELGIINHLRFRDPEHFRAGIIHSRLLVARWTSLKSSVRGFEWSVFSVLLKETSRDNFIMLIHLPPFSLKTPLHVHSSRISSVTLLSYGCLLGCYQLGEKLELSPPQLILPLTVEPSKPRLCNDERFLNLWIKDLPFKLDHLSDLPRYVTWSFPDYVRRQKWVSTCPAPPVIGNLLWPQVGRFLFRVSYVTFRMEGQRIYIPQPRPRRFARRTLARNSSVAIH